MRKPKSERAKAPRKQPVRARAGVSRVKARGGEHWFDHPEMQARIAKAEEDRREARVKRFGSRDAALAYLDGLA
jgi:hypothetical protein